MIKKLIYLSDALLGSKKASEIHTIKQYYALRSFVQVDLICLCDHNYKNKDLDGHFMKISFEILGRLGIFIQFYVLLRNKISNNALYSRYTLISLIPFAGQYVIEYHKDSWNSSGLERFALRRALKSKRCLGLAFITHELKSTFEANYSARFPLHVLPDASEIHEIEEDYTAENVMYFGSFKRGKGVDKVVRIASLMSDVKFYIAGGTLEDFSSLFGNCSVANNVCFLGYIPHDEMRNCVIKHSIGCFLLPNDKEVYTGKIDIGQFTSPLKMFEYMALKRPLIASNLPVLREILNEECAYLVDADDLDGWVSKIREALSNKSHSSFLVKNAENLLRNNYTWQKRSEQILKIYECSNYNSEKR